jgi:hypothetical protein
VARNNHCRHFEHSFPSPVQTIGIGG